MWIELTAAISPERKSPVSYNTDHIVIVMEGNDGGAIIFALDGSSYPVVESRQQIMKLIAGKQPGARTSRK